MFKSIVISKYKIITADFKTVELKFIDQGAEKSLVKEYLEKFKKLRDRNKLSGDEKNIDTWGKKSFQEFQEKLDELEKTKTKTEQRKGALDTRKKIPGVEVIAENEDWIVYQIESNAAAAELGKGTEWCIRFNPSEHWEDYSSKNNIYFIISKNIDDKDQWYKIALLVDLEGKKTYWDINDIDHISVPSNLNLPNFKVENYKLDTEEKKLKAVKKDAEAIYNINNPSEQVQLEAVKKHASAITYIKNPSEQVQLEAVKKNESAIQYINNPSEQVQLEAVKKNGDAIAYINNPSEAVQLEAVKKNRWAIQYINNPSEAVQLEAVKKDIRAIEYIKKPSEQVQLKAVKQEGVVIKFIKNPSEQVQIEAVKQNRYAIEYIENPTEKVLKLARGEDV